MALDITARELVRRFAGSTPADQDGELVAIYERLMATWSVEQFENELEEYWKRGKGAARIRWGTPGDWTRCKRLLTKHVGSERAKRICAQWHRDVNGYYPGDDRNK